MLVITEDGKMFFNNKIVTPFKNSRGFGVCFGGKKQILTTVLINHYNLVPPDNNFTYYLKFKNGLFDFSLSNLKWVNRKKSMEQFNEDNKIVGKICSCCKENKKIEDFSKETGNNYRNECNKCKYQKYKRFLKENLEKLQNFKTICNNWNKTKKGKEYHKLYDKKYRDDLKKGYIATSLKMSVKDIPNSFYQLKKQQILLTRKLKQHDN